MLKPTVQIHNVNGVLVAEFWDCLRLDPGAVQDLRSKYEAHVRAGGRPEVVVDLLGVGFAGSAALGHFVALHRVARPKNGRLVFCNVDPTVFEVFRVSKLDPLFTFAGDRAEALKEVDRPAATAATGGAGGPGASVNGPGAGRGEAQAGPLRKTRQDGLLRASQRRKLS
jgi:anti-anti-sigma factor